MAEFVFVDPERCLKQEPVEEVYLPIKNEVELLEGSWQQKFGSSSALTVNGVASTCILSNDVKEEPLEEHPSSSFESAAVSTECVDELCSDGGNSAEVQGKTSSSCLQHNSSFLKDTTIVFKTENVETASHTKYDLTSQYSTNLSHFSDDSVILPVNDIINDSGIFPDSDISDIKTSACSHSKPSPFVLYADKFNTKPIPQRHNVLHCNDNSFPYTLCGATFRDKSGIKQHASKHSSEETVTHSHYKPFVCTGEKRLICSSCPARFRRKYHLNRHILTQHMGGNCFACSTCTATFRKKSHLNKHVFRQHIHEKCFTCSICTAKFSHNYNLKQHMLTHTGKKLFKCTMCPARFNYRASMKNHILSHSSEKTFSCTVCSAAFKTSVCLKQHFHKHTGENVWSCAMCTAKFSHKYKLNQHMMTHTGEKPYECAECTRKFRLKSLLKNHIFTIHMKIL